MTAQAFKDKPTVEDFGLEVDPDAGPVQKFSMSFLDAPAPAPVVPIAHPAPPPTVPAQRLPHHAPPLSSIDGKYKLNIFGDR